jgi:hypothetical protein
MTVTRFLLLGFALLQSHAAETGLTGPVLGYVFDPANGLQPIRGISGALTVGAPLDLPDNLGKLVVAPRQDYALAIAASDSHVLRLEPGLAIENLGLAIGATDVIALSPAGTAAAFYDREKNRIQVIAGLPSKGRIAREFELSAFPGALASLTVDDSAEAVVVGFSGVANDAIVALGVDGSVRTLTGARSASASCFLSGTRDVLIADGPASRVYLLKDVTGTAEPLLLAEDTTTFVDPAAVAASKDNKQAFVVSSGMPGVARIDLAGGGVTFTPCNCAPSQLTPLSGKAVFRLTEPSSEPMWLFDADAAEPRIVFVPPYRPAEEPVQ